MSKELYPLKLTPVCKEIIWGGERLKSEFGKSAPFDKIAESWELTVRPDGMNVIENGIYAGMTLSEYLSSDEKFPLLIKLIDACDRLSIQVHPDDEYAQKFEGEFGKTEVWYIVDALPGSRLIWGLKDYSPSKFRSALENGTLEEHMNYVEVKKGDVFFIPSGCVHAIGAGILIAEIQQSSNVTYRVYDYMRRDKNGKLRELHVEKALDVIVDFTPDEIEALRFSNGRGDYSIVNCKYFSVDKYDLTEPISLSADKSFIHLLCLDGEGYVGDQPIKKGDGYLIPKGLSVEVSGNLSVIASKMN